MTAIFYVRAIDVWVKPSQFDTRIFGPEAPVCRRAFFVALI